MLIDLKMFDILRTKEWYCKVSGGAENLIQTKLVKSKYWEIFPKIWRWGGIGKPVFCRSSYSLRYMEQTQEGSQELKKKGFPLKREIDDWETGDWQRRYFPGLWDIEARRHWGHDVEASDNEARRRWGQTTLRPGDVEARRRWGQATLRPDMYE